MRAKRLLRAGVAVGLLIFAGCGSDDPSGAPGNTAGTGGSGGQSGAAGEAGAAGQGQGGGAPLEEVQGCSAEVKLLAAPADPAARGPWPVGARTLTLGGLTTEIWYPASPGSEQGKAPVTYDLRQWLPASEKSKIPDDAAPVQTCGCHRDLPLDEARGPYPIVLFVHGTAAFRTQSLPHMEHWASRGFVVVAADHPGLYLADALDFKLGASLPANVQTILDALEQPAGDLAFLAQRLDRTRIGLVGHSAGGNGIRGFGQAPGVRVLIPLAAGGVDPASPPESTLIMGGKIDKVVNYSGQKKGYDEAVPTRRLVGLDNAGHLFPTDLCWMSNASGQNIVQTATQYQIKNANLASGLFDCPEGGLGRERARDIVNHATTAALEEKLACRPGDPFQGFQETHPEVAEFLQDLAP
jgi:hypothetical protein